MTNEPELDAELRAERAAYLRELAADLDDIEQLILNLPKPDGAVDRKRKLAREVHSIKGVAGSYDLDLISVAVHRLEDDLAIEELASGDIDKFVDVLLRHKDRLAQLAAAYLNDDQQALADLRLMFAAPAREPSAEHPGTTPPPSARALLVDTSRATLKACIGALKECGVHEIATVQDGYEALGRLLQEPFQVIITSLHVPTIDGQCLMPVLRTIPGPNQMTPVILLTSSAAAIDASVARPDHIVEKNPNMTQRLKRIVGAIIGAPAPAAPPVGIRSPRGLKKIALVDDSPAIHHLVRTSFKRFPGIEIASLEDPTHAVEFVRQQQPDLVLLDLNMPQLSGKDVMRGIRASADLQTIPVAFFTAADGVDERGELMDLGAWYVFKKPFLPKTFADELIRAYNEF